MGWGRTVVGRSDPLTFSLKKKKNRRDLLTLLGLARELQQHNRVLVSSASLSAVPQYGSEV